MANVPLRELLAEWVNKANLELLVMRCDYSILSRLKLTFRSIILVYHLSCLVLSSQGHQGPQGSMGRPGPKGEKV